MSNDTERIVLECDELDAKWIHEAIAKCQLQANSFGEYSILPDGEGNMAGRVIAEICRDWLEEYSP